MARKRQSPKSRIVKSAWNLFYKNGYEGTTINDIITASKTSKGTFYHYFKGKDALLNTLAYLLDDKYEELTATMDPNLSACDKMCIRDSCTNTAERWQVPHPAVRTTASTPSSLNI